MMKFAIASVAAIVAASLISSTASAAVTFGTDAAGNALSLDHTALVGGPPPASGGVSVVGGQLQFTNSGPGNIDQEVQVTSGTFFGSNVNGTPYIQVSWIDENTGGTVPNIDFYATDTRAGKLGNRVVGGSLFGLATGSGAVGVAKYNGQPSDEYDQTYAPGTRAAIGTSVAHTLRIGKDAAGLIHFEFDGVADASPSDVFLNDAGLGTDQSAWGTVELRVRGQEAGETVRFTELSFGNNFVAVPEPTAIAAIAGAAVLLLGRRRRRQA